MGIITKYVCDIERRYNMIQFKHGALWAGGISCRVPDGFFLETDPGEEARPWGVTLYAPDRSYSVRLYWEEEATGAEEELEELLSDGEYVLLSPISPFTTNGLEGFHATYQSGGYGYYEARFDLPPNGDGLAAFVILVCTNEKDEIRRSVQREEFLALMGSVEAQA